MLSRVVDCLYWMSRYLERAEHTARLMDVHLNLMLDSAPGLRGQQRRERLLRSLLLESKDYRDEIDEERLLQRLTFDTTGGISLISHIISARENARQVREQISSEMWMQINRLYLAIRSADRARLWNDQPHEFYHLVKEGAHLFQGITDATMNHNQGWHFIQLGRYLERTLSLVALLSGHFRAEAFISTTGDDDYFELLAILKSATAFEAYCKVYSSDLKSHRIVEFLLFDQEFPHSARFSVEQIVLSLNALAEATALQKNHRIHRLIGRLQSGLSYDEISEVLSGDFHAYLGGIHQQTQQINEVLLNTYINYSIESALR